MAREPAGALKIAPLTPERWPDLVDLFGPERGALSGCWCMWARLGRKVWSKTPRDERRDGLEAVVREGPAPGLIAYRDGQAVGWVAVGPRPSVGGFNDSKVSAPVDTSADTARVFAITCFFIRAGHRRQGLMAHLAEAAVAHAKKQRANAVEVCAIDTGRKLVWGEGFVGLAPVFEKLGFREIARRTPTRPLMRFDLSSRPKRSEEPGARGECGGPASSRPKRSEEPGSRGECGAPASSRPKRSEEPGSRGECGAPASSRPKRSGEPGSSG